MPLHHQQSTTHCELIGKSTQEKKVLKRAHDEKSLQSFENSKGKFRFYEHWTFCSSHLKLNFLTRTHTHTHIFIHIRMSRDGCLDGEKKERKKEGKLLYHAIDFSSRIKSHYVDVANDATFYIHTQFFSRSFHHSNTQLQLYFFLAGIFPSRSIRVAFLTIAKGRVRNEGEGKRKLPSQVVCSSHT